MSIVLLRGRVIWGFPPSWGAEQGLREFSEEDKKLIKPIICVQWFSYKLAIWQEFIFQKTTKLGWNVEPLLFEGEENSKFHIDTQARASTHKYTHTSFWFGEWVSRSRCWCCDPSRCAQSPLLLTCQILEFSPLGGFQSFPVISRYPNPMLVWSSTVISPHSISSLPLRGWPLHSSSKFSLQGEEGRWSRLVWVIPRRRAPLPPLPSGGCTALLVAVITHFPKCNNLHTISQFLWFTVNAETN